MKSRPQTARSGFTLIVVMFALLIFALLAAAGVLVLVRAGWSNPEGRPRASLQRVEYRLVEDRLERRVYPYLDGARPGPPQVLYQGVSAPALAFISEGAEAPRFLPSPGRPLPDAVRLDLTLEGYGPVRQLFVVGGGR